MSEAKRNVLRIGSNYIRLLLTLAIGMSVVWIMVGLVGTEAYGLIALLGSSIGIASILLGVIRRSLVRELGAALHTNDPDHFRSMFNSSLLLCLVAAVITVGLFLILYLCIPLFNMADELRPAARTFVLAMSVQAFFVISLAPFFTMYLVSERMVIYNGWLTLQRLCLLGAALFVAYLSTGSDPGHDVALYGVASSVCLATMMIIAALVMMATEPRVLPNPRLIRMDACRSILAIGGWNTGVALAVDSQRQVDALIMNIPGLIYNAVWGFAFQLSSYIWMCTSGVTTGLDAVAARLSTQGHEQALRRLVHHSTRLHGLATFPAAVGLVVLAEPILQIWLGSRLSDPATQIPPAVVLTRILAVGLSAYAISSCWMFIFYGAGHIRRYAPLILAGAVCNPIIALLLFQVLPGSISYIAPAIAYSIVMLIAHMILMPLRTAPELGLRLRDLYLPLIRPLVVTALAAPALLVGARVVEQWNLLSLAAVAAVYGALVGALTWVFVVDGSERKRIAQALRRQLGWGQAVHAGSEEGGPRTP